MLVAIPLFERFTALDAVGPYEVLQRVPSIDVVFVGHQRGEVRSDKDLVLKARPTRSEKVAHADPAPKESGSAFVIPEKRPPRKKRNNTDIIEGLKSLKRKMPFQEPKLPLGRRETAELALEKRCPSGLPWHRALRRRRQPLSLPRSRWSCHRRPRSHRPSPLHLKPSPSAAPGAA